ncbi:MAG: methyltransferase domain-containing protein [Candidatus Omnitrophota bacterium]|nr:methyltransferase domain-containing protein [Candidatus Omnitrophota bacterium]
MKDFLSELLICPSCKAKLKLYNAEYINGEIEYAKLVCGCGREYPVTNGIPRFVANDGYVENFSFEWNRFNKTQLDSFNRTEISQVRFREVTGFGPEQLKGKFVLEAGCGMGRFLEAASKTADQVIGIDLSFSVDAAMVNLRKFPNVHLIQADIYNLPLPLKSFDLIYSIGVLHHTPDPKAAFLRIAQLLRDKGAIAIWMSPKSRFPFLPKATSIARIFTTRMRKERLLNIIESVVPKVLPLVRVPVIGRSLKGWVIPVCDYKGKLPLIESQLLEWSILDTFDLLSPKYLYEYSPWQIRGWLTEAGLSDIITTSPAIVARGKAILG